MQGMIINFGYIFFLAACSEKEDDFENGEEKAAKLEELIAKLPLTDLIPSLDPIQAIIEGFKYFKENEFEYAYMTPCQCLSFITCSIFLLRKNQTWLRFFCSKLEKQFVC